VLQHGPASPLHERGDVGDLHASVESDDRVANGHLECALCRAPRARRQPQFDRLDRWSTVAVPRGTATPDAADGPGGDGSRELSPPQGGPTIEPALSLRRSALAITIDCSGPWRSTQKIFTHRKEKATPHQSNKRLRRSHTRHLALATTTHPSKTGRRLLHLCPRHLKWWRLRYPTVSGASRAPPLNPHGGRALPRWQAAAVGWRPRRAL
jgi:hypothetical protein